MPPQTGTRTLLERYGKQMTDSHARHAGEKTKLEDNSRLPEGIEGGIAQLVDCKIGEFKEGKLKGQPFFMAQGVVHAPEYHNGQKVRGKRTSVIEPMCPTPERATRKTFDDHYDWLMKFLRAFGVNTEKVTPAGLEGTLELLKKSKPFFSFRTWKGQKQTTGPYAGKEPQVNETWGERCDAPEVGGSAEAAAAATTDDSGPADAADEDAAAGPAGEYSDQMDLSTLVETASNDDDPGQADAQARLKELAMAAGHDEATVDAADDWQAVADLAGTPPEAAAEEAAPEPAKGEVWVAKLKDPKNPKAAARKVECTVQAVALKDRTADLKRNDTKALVKGVSWDLMEPV